MYSAPTSKGGVRANVIDADVVYTLDCGKTVNASDDMDAWVKQANVENTKLNNGVTNTILLTSKGAGAVTSLAKKMGAVGIISDFIPLYKNVRDSAMDLKGHSRWDNASWAPINDTGLFAFDLAPETGEALRARVVSGPVTVHATVDTTFRDGENFVVSCAVKGETDEEVFAYGHLYEPGALDNASGCAILISLADTINRLVGLGKLPKPKRTLRFVIGWECVGSTAWLIANPQRQRNTVAGLVADMVGTEAIDNTFLRIWHNAHSNYGFTDALIEELLPAHHKHLNQNYPVAHREFGIATDNVIGDTYWGIPAVSFITEPALSYHSSMDTADRIDPEILVRCAVLIGTYMWECAQMENNEKQRLDAIAIDALGKLNPALRKEIESPAPSNGGKIPRRVTQGCINLAGRPDLTGAKWQMSWNTELHLPLFWVNGVRDMEQITRLAAAEAGREDLDEYRIEMTDLFDFLNANGYKEDV